MVLGVFADAVAADAAATALMAWEKAEDVVDPEVLMISRKLIELGGTVEVHEVTEEASDAVAAAVPMDPDGPITTS